MNDNENRFWLEWKNDNQSCGSLISAAKSTLYYMYIIYIRMLNFNKLLTKMPLWFEKDKFDLLLTADWLNYSSSGIVS